MTTISGSPSIGPLVQQQTEHISSNTSQPFTDAATVALVVGAVETADEQTTIARALVALETMKGQLHAVQASLSDAVKIDFHQAAVGELASKANKLEQRINVMAGALEQLPPLTLERSNLQSRLNEGGLSWNESTTIGNRLQQLNHQIDLAGFQAQTGGNFYEYCEFQRAPALRLEAGTLRSRLADGGLSPTDLQRTQDRLEYVEQSLISVEKNIANGRRANLPS